MLWNRSLRLPLVKHPLIVGPHPQREPTDAQQPLAPQVPSCRDIFVAQREALPYLRVHQALKVALRRKQPLLDDIDHLLRLMALLGSLSSCPFATQ